MNKEILKEKTTEELVALFEETVNNKMDEDVATVRGYIMEELALKDEEAFAQWIEGTEASPRKAFLEK